MTYTVTLTADALTRSDAIALSLRVLALAVTDQCNDLTVGSVSGSSRIILKRSKKGQPLTQPLIEKKP